MVTSQSVLHDAEERMKKSIESLLREFGTVRTGRASPALVEGIKVDCYNSVMPLKQLASIATPDPKLVVITPWDLSIIGDIEKAIQKSELGISPVNDGKSIRIGIPQLSKERRDELTKLVKKMAEDDRISIRTIRRDANESIKKLHADKLISEDETFKSQEHIQKLTDKYIARVDDVLSHKERELMEV